MYVISRAVAPSRVARQGCRAGVHGATRLSRQMRWRDEEAPARQNLTTNVGSLA